MLSIVYLCMLTVWAIFLLFVAYAVWREKIDVKALMRSVVRRR